MQKYKIKNELEFIILSEMLNNADSLLYITQRIKPEQLNTENRELFEKLSELTETDPIMRRLHIKTCNIKGWDISQLERLPEAQGLSYIISKNILKSFYDIYFSIEKDKMLKDILKENENRFDGLTSLIELREKIDQCIKTTDNFKKQETLSDRIKKIIDEVLSDKRQDEVYKINSIPTFNYLTGGLRLSNLVAIAGSFKSGKTTLGLNMIYDFIRQGIPCGVFEFELSDNEINSKLAGMFCGVSYENLRDYRKLTEQERENLKSFDTNKIPQLQIETKILTENEIKQTVKFWRDSFGVKVILIDYIGFIKSNKKFETRERELSHYSNFLKQLAKELDIIVIALSQLNRQGRENPKIDNLAESIALARDCDFVFVIANKHELKMKDESGKIYPEDHFFVKLEASRHTKHRGSFDLKLNNDGVFIELASDYTEAYTYQLDEDIF